MKLIIVYFITALIIIDDVQNAPGAIHPIHVQTIPLHPVTSGRVPTPSKHPHSGGSIPSTRLTSSPSTPSSTTHYHQSSWNNIVVFVVCRIFLYAIAILLLSKVLRTLCKSKKPNKSPIVVKNKMCISTINGQREEAPPAYANIHKV